MSRLFAFAAAAVLSLALAGPAVATRFPALLLDGICHTGGTGDTVIVELSWSPGMNPRAFTVGAGIEASDPITYYGTTYQVTTHPNVRTATFSMPMAWFTANHWVWAQVAGLNRFGAWIAYAEVSGGGIFVDDIPLCG